MSDNIPFDIQMEIIKWLPVKPLIQFRSVSKPWKSFIDSPDFIKGYGACHTQSHSLILRYRLDGHICLVDDDIETFKVPQQQLVPFVVSPFRKQYSLTDVVGACHGLLFLYGFHQVYKKWMVVIWNPSIRKSFSIAAPHSHTASRIHYGFGVCPVTKDPTVVKINCRNGTSWHVEVFTLSSGAWNVIPSGNLPHQTVRLDNSTQIVIDRFIYWGAYEETFTDDGVSTTNHMVVSFDLITKEFKVVDLPDSLTNKLISRVSVSKLRGSLVVSGHVKVEGAICCGVWVMEHDSSFRKLFSIGAHVSKILGFRKNGEPIFEIQKANGQFTTLNVYDPCSQEIKYLGISRVEGSFFIGSYKESLLLLDHSNLHIYSNNN